MFLFLLLCVGVLAQPRPICVENEVFLECGSACETTCETYENPPIVCPDACILNTCQCAEGFVRHNDKCIKPENCPAKREKRGANLMQKIGIANVSFVNEKPEVLTALMKMCKRICVNDVCQCAKGFVRNAEGKCVTLSECPEKKAKRNAEKECPANEEFLVCGTRCEPTCKDPKPVMCKRSCVVNVCQCLQGFVRNEEGNCVSLDQCPAQ